MVISSVLITSSLRSTQKNSGTGTLVATLRISSQAQKLWKSQQALAKHGTLVTLRVLSKLWLRWLQDKLKWTNSSIELSFSPLVLELWKDMTAPLSRKAQKKVQALYTRISAASVFGLSVAKTGTTMLKKSVTNSLKSTANGPETSGEMKVLED